MDELPTFHNRNDWCSTAWPNLYLLCEVSGISAAVFKLGSFTKCSPWVQLSHLECGFITSFHSYHFWEIFKRDYIKMSEENPDMEKTWKNNLCMKSLKCPIWWSHPSTFNLAKHQTFNHPNLAKMVVQVEVPETIGSFISPNKNSSWNHPCPTSKLGLPAMPRSELRSGDRDLKKRTAATQKIPDNWNTFI